MSGARVADAVLFDLDGTLADTAPDLLAAVQVLRAELGLDPIALGLVAPAVREGAAAIIRAGLPEFPDLHAGLFERYLGFYLARIAVLTELYPGVADVLGRLERAGIPWGVVTNKPAWLTQPLLAELGLARRATVVVSGDTLPQRKPDPAPVTFACRALHVDAARTWFVGDDLRDVQAGKAAGTRTVIADYGYMIPGDAPESWGADYRIARAADLTGLLRLG